MYKLVIGIGNELRADDGAGAVIVRKLEHYALPGVQTEIITQLTPEWLERMAAASMTILVDVRLPQSDDDGQVWLQPLQQSSTGNAVGHSLNISELVALGERLYGKSMDVQICSVPAYDFTIGNPMSTKTAALADQAISKLKALLEKI